MSIEPRNCVMSIILKEHRSISTWIFLTVLLSGFISFSSCNSDDDAVNADIGIVGQWKLVEVLLDPGDGSGEYMPVESSRTITFAEDGTYTSNADICSLSEMSGEPASGNYKEVENGYTIECDSPFPSPLFLSLDNGDLIIAFFCIEPCLQKFKRLD